MPYTRNETGSYAWPTAYQESPSEADWQALVDAGLYTQEQIDSMKAGGSYLGYRTAITRRRRLAVLRGRRATRST